MSDDFKYTEARIHERPLNFRRQSTISMLMKKPLTLHATLLVLTILSTYLTAGVWYSLAIISILFFHEMGHYLMCRRYRVQASLPYFIPFPFLNPFGTLGAVIKMRGIIPSRRALFDIGAAGPIAGLILTIPALYFGIILSKIVPASQVNSSSFFLGESLLFKAISFLAVGVVSHDHDVLLHPLAYAGWTGLFVTALNLLPIGQLDGGHIFYSIFGKASKKTTYGFLGALGVLTVIYPGWALLFALLLFLGRKHPPPFDDYTPLDKNRRLIGIIIFIIFLTSFTPIPFKI